MGGARQIDISAALEASALFRTLSEDERRALVRRAISKRVVARSDADPLYRQGDRDGPALYLLSGEGPLLQLVIEAGPGDPDQRGTAQAGRRVRTGYRLMGGEVAGDLDLLLGGLAPALPPRFGTAWPLADHWAIALPAAEIARLAEVNPAFRRRLVRDASRRLAGMLDQGARAGPLAPDVAFAVALLDLFDDFGAPATGPVETLARKVSQQEAADLMGLSLRTFSARATDWTTRGLIDTTPLSILDRDRVERIAAAARMPGPAALAATWSAAATLIAAGERQRGAAMAADGLALWPGNPALVYLIALALARAGDRAQAERLFAEPALTFRGSLADLRARVRTAWRESLSLPDDGPEGDAGLTQDAAHVLCRDIAALQARLAKEDALSRPLETSADRTGALHRAAALYAEVDASVPSAFAAVNAATLLHLAGDPQAAARMARRASLLAAGTDHWDHATRGEAALLLGRAGEALAEYRQAAARAGAGDLASMRRQLAHLERGGVAAADLCLAATDPGPVLVVSGSILARTAATTARLDAAADQLTARLGQRMGQGSPATERLIVSLAAGTDLLAARAAVEAGVPVDAILPFPLSEFRRTSVEPGGGTGRDWQAELDRLLPHLRSVTVLWDAGGVPGTHLRAHFERANVAMLGAAVLAAGSLHGRAEVLAFGAEESAAARLARAAGTLPGVSATLVPLDLPRPPDQPRPTRPVDPFAAVIFVQFPEPAPHQASLLKELRLDVRTTRARRLVGVRVVPDLSQAAAQSRVLAAEVAKRGGRVSLDHGPVQPRPGHPPDDEAMARLVAAQVRPAMLSPGAPTVSLAAGLVLAGLGHPGLVELAFGGTDSAEGGAALRRMFRLNLP